MSDVDDTGFDDEEFEDETVQAALAETSLPEGEVPDDPNLSREDRESRLRNLVLGLIPLTGGLTAVMALLWRRYLGEIGVRPVDIAVDPTTRLVDMVFALSNLIAFYGPLLFIGSWLDLMAGSDQRIATWIAKHRKLARLIMTVTLLVTGAALAGFAQIIGALFVGPLVAALILARIFDLDDEIPRPLRITRLKPSRAIAGAVLTALVALTALSVEVLVIGPKFDGTGAIGVIAPTVLGFRAQPMIAIAVDGSSDPRGRLYLGGNADLYVLVDPCSGNEVEYVSVGSTRLVVVDEITCE